MAPDQFRRLLENLAASTPDIIYMFTADWEELVFVNDGYEELWGRPIEALETDAQDFMAGIHPDDRPRVRNAMERVSAGESVDLEYRVNADQDFGRWAWTRGTPIRDEDGEVAWVGGFVRDVTERKEREREVERSRETLRQVIDLVPDLLFAKNADGEYILANEAVAEAYGRSVEEVEGRTTAELTADEKEANAFLAADREVLETGEPAYIPEEELTTADGTTRILQTRKLPFDLPGSDERAVLGYARDVTDLKEYERTLEAQRDRLELLNTVVRHDIRNDMQVIRGRGELLEDHVDADGEAHLEELLQSAREAIGRTQTARDLTRTMLRGEDHTEAVALERSIDAQVEAVRSRYSDATVEVERPLPGIDVVADELLNSVLDNLLTNAIVHNDSEDPQVTVAAERDGASVTVTVADNGPGLPDGVREDVFEPGEKGLDSGGTGLGLYLVDTLVDQYGGSVDTWANEPRGTVFEVTLPVADGD